jgi:hypothetical protein
MADCVCFHENFNCVTRGTDTRGRSMFKPVLSCKHLTQVSVVRSRSDLERKGEGKKRYRKKGGRGRIAKFLPKTQEWPENSMRQTMT